MGNVIYENESILVATNEDELSNESDSETSHITSDADFINAVIEEVSLPGIIINVVFYAIVIALIVKAVKKRKAKKAQEAAFEQKYAEKNAYDNHSSNNYSSGSSSSGNSGYDFDDNDPDFRAFIRKMIDEQGHSGPIEYYRKLYAYYRATTGKTTYDGTYTRNDNNSYNNYSNQNDSSYSSGTSSNQPTNPFSDKFEGKTPDEARKIYLKYMKAFHSDTGDGSDDEDVKLINAAYDEYKKAHGIK
jgi:hypothetical protein